MTNADKLNTWLDGWCSGQDSCDSCVIKGLCEILDHEFTGIKSDKLIEHLSKKVYKSSISD